MIFKLYLTGTPPLSESGSVPLLATHEWSFRELPRSELPVETWRRFTQQNDILRSVYERERDSLDPEFVAWFDEVVLGD